MFLQTQVETVITNQGRHYTSLGYSVPKQGQRLTVKREHLSPNSNIRVACKCDRCPATFNRQYQLLVAAKEHLCFACSNKIRNKGNLACGRANKQRIGPKHPRWNSDKAGYKAYRAAVWSLTRKQPLHLLEHHEKPRGRCGVEGAYQLDHKISIKDGFDAGIPPEQIAGIENLAFLPWQENRKKGARSSLG